MNLLSKNTRIETAIVCRDSNGEPIGVYKSIEDAQDDMLIDDIDVLEYAIEHNVTLDYSGTGSREQIIIVTEKESELASKFKQVMQQHATTLSQTQNQSQNRGMHAHHEASISVVQLSLTNSFIAQYDSIYDACRKTGARNISKCCKGEAKSSGGFRWMYADSYFE